MEQKLIPDEKCPEHLKCYRCKLYLIDAVIYSCGHEICGKCFKNELLCQHRDCACDCNCESGSDPVASYRTRIEVSGLKVECNNSIFGCDRTCDIGEIHSHKNDCDMYTYAYLDEMHRGIEYMMKLFEPSIVKQMGDTTKGGENNPKEFARKKYLDLTRHGWKQFFANPKLKVPTP